VAAETLTIAFPQKLVTMDLVPFATDNFGPVKNSRAPPTQLALARRKQQPELRRLGPCLSAYLACYPEEATMLCDLPPPESRTVRLPRLLCYFTIQLVHFECLHVHAASIDPWYTRLLQRICFSASPVQSVCLLDVLS